MTAADPNDDYAYDETDVQPPNETVPTTFMLGNEVYDFLKLLVTVLVPGLSTLYVGLAAVWELPAADKVSGTAVVLIAFLGLILRFSTRRYNEVKYNGDLVVTPAVDGKKALRFELNDDPGTYDGLKELTFKVVHKDE